MTGSPRAVLFDLGNTLVGYYRARDFAPILHKSIVGVSECLSERTGTAIDSDGAYLHALDLNAEDPEFRVRPLEGRLVEIFRDVRFTQTTLDEACSVFLRPIFDCAVLDPDALRTLAAIRERGLRLGIVSNTPWGSSADPWRRELRRHGLDAAVDTAVFCVDVGWRKPAPQIFERALTLLGVEARETIFVGDDPRWDIAGARRSGLRPVLLDPDGDSAADGCEHIHSLTELIPLMMPGRDGSS